MCGTSASADRLLAVHEARVAADELVVVGDDEALAYVLAQSDSEDLGLTDEQVAAIFLADDDYQRSIGAIRA